MVEVDDQEFERAREFKYLGSAVTEDNASNITIKIKQNCNEIELVMIIYLGRQTKCTLYDTLVRLVLMEVKVGP
jgi:hypothetical protein